MPGTTQLASCSTWQPQTLELTCLPANLPGPQDDASDCSDDELQDLPDPWSVLEGPDDPDASRLPSDDGGCGGSGGSGGPSRVSGIAGPRTLLLEHWTYDPRCLQQNVLHVGFIIPRPQSTVVTMPLSRPVVPSRPTRAPPLASPCSTTGSWTTACVWRWPRGTWTPAAAWWRPAPLARRCGPSLVGLAVPCLLVAGAGRRCLDGHRCSVSVCTYARCHSRTWDLPPRLHPSFLPTCSCAAPGARPRGGRKS